MRWFICAVAVLAFAPSAFAQDFDVLRGSETVGPATFTKWSGFYFGGQIELQQWRRQFHERDLGANCL